MKTKRVFMIVVSLILIGSGGGVNAGLVLDGGSSPDSSSWIDFGGLRAHTYGYSNSGSASIYGQGVIKQGFLGNGYIPEYFSSSIYRCWESSSLHFYFNFQALAVDNPLLVLPPINSHQYLNVNLPGGFSVGLSSYVKNHARCVWDESAQNFIQIQTPDIEMAFKVWIQAPGGVSIRDTGIYLNLCNLKDKAGNLNLDFPVWVDLNGSPAEVSATLSLFEEDPYVPQYRIPEPASLALLSLGAAAVFIPRKR